MVNRKKCGQIAVCAAFLIVLLSGCAMPYRESDSEDTITPTDDTLTVVGVSQIGSESVWRTANTVSIQQTFTKENGYFLIFDNARQKQENQIKALRSFISQRVDYIVFSPITEEGWDTVLEEAKEAQIPVILIDRKIRAENESLYTAWVGSDFEEEGESAGRILEEQLREEGREQETVHIVILKGTKGATATIGRTEGFLKVAAQYENWKILECVDAEFTTAKGREEMERLLARYPDIDVVISQNDDMTFGVVEAVRAAGKKTGQDGDIAVISFDATKAALEMVEQGILNADIECNPEQGPYIEEIIRKLEKNETVEKEYYVPERVFTRENVAKYMEKRIY